MSQHYDAAIGSCVSTNEQRAARMEELKGKLNAGLHRKFEQEVGYPIPTAHQAEILSVETALMACDDARKSHFLAGVRTLVNTRFDIDLPVRDWAMGVATVAVGKIFDGAPGSDTRGSHAAREVRSGETLQSILFAAIYASTVRCGKEEWGSEQDFYLSQFVFTVFRPHLAELLGKYECHKYDGTSAKNDYHYVTVSKISDVEVLWTTKAGAIWKLTATQEREKLAVGPECPYFKAGYTFARIVREGSQMSGIIGPCGELYEKYA